MSFNKRNKHGPSSSKMETESGMDFDFKKIMKEVELLGKILSIVCSFCKLFFFLIIPRLSAAAA